MPGKRADVFYIAGGAAPDLRWSSVPPSKESFLTVVRDGDLLSEGMPHFDDLPPETLEDIRFYLRTRANELLQPKRPDTAGTPHPLRAVSS